MGGGGGACGKVCMYVALFHLYSGIITQTAHHKACRRHRRERFLCYNFQHPAPWIGEIAAKRGAVVNPLLSLAAQHCVSASYYVRPSGIPPYMYNEACTLSLSSDTKRTFSYQPQWVVGPALGGLIQRLRLSYPVAQTPESLGLNHSFSRLQLCNDSKKKNHG